MLILTRRIGEAIMIGDEIKVTVLPLRRGLQVGLGIEAPRDIPVHRKEIYKRIQREEAEARADPATE